MVEKCKVCGSKKEGSLLFCEACRSKENRAKTFEKRLQVVVKKFKDRYGLNKNETKR